MQLCCRIHYSGHDRKKNCCAKFLFIVPPSNSISSGKFSALGPLGTGDWTRIITGNRNGGKMGTLWLQIVLPSKLIGQRRHRCRSFIGPSRHQSVISQVPLKFKTFFFFYEEEEASSYNQTLVTDLHSSSPQKKTHSIIHTSVPDTRLHTHKKNGSNKGRGRLFSVNLFFCYQTSEQAETWCEATFFCPG